jgi:uncharacterized repeat protein (TIGR04076 family)
VAELVEHKYETPDVRITVKEVIGHDETQGRCPLRVGQSWTFNGSVVPEGFCIWSVPAILPYLSALHWNGDVHWVEEKPESATAGCPNYMAQVVFEMVRVPAEAQRSDDPEKSPAFA